MSDVLRAAGDALADAAIDLSTAYAGTWPPCEKWTRLRDEIAAWRAARDAAPADEIDRLRARVAELEAASPDDAHTSTARHTEWLTVGTEDGDEGAETFETEDEAQRAADRWRRRGMTNVYVERHDVATTRTVSTTTRTTDWKADDHG